MLMLTERTSAYVLNAVVSHALSIVSCLMNKNLSM